MQADKRLLIVDDDKIYRVIYSSIATKMNYRVDHADSPAAADAALRAADYHAVILDLMLGEATGLDVLALMSGLAVSSKIVLVTGASDAAIEETFEDRPRVRARNVWPGAQTRQRHAYPHSAEKSRDRRRAAPKVA